MTTEVFCNWTIAGKATAAAALARTVALSGVPITPVAGFESIKPLPARSNRIDPETVLKRKASSAKVRGEANLTPIKAMLQRLEASA